MHLVPEQHLTGPIVSVPVNYAQLESELEPTDHETIVTVKEISQDEAGRPIIPYCMQMAERTYPWIERDSLYGIQHRLQNFDICLPRPLEESPVESTAWVLYVLSFDLRTYTIRIHCS